MQRPVFATPDRSQSQSSRCYTAQGFVPGSAPVKWWKLPEQIASCQATLHELVEARAAASPYACAVCWGDHEMTYQQLNEKANQLAHYLRDQGVGPGVCVGVCLERSVTLIISLLAILKTGGVYVPLDPAYSIERLAHILNETDARLVLTQHSVLTYLPQTGVPLLLVGAIEEELMKLPKTPVASTVEPLYLACVMYNGGNDERSRGSMLTHQNITGLVYQPEYVHVQNRDVFLHHASMSSDAALFEIWACLTNGARLVLAPPHVLSPIEISRLLNRWRISVLWLTGSLFQRIVEEQLESLRSVRQLMIKGETLSVFHVRKALEALPHCRLINGYGPVEDATLSCCYTIQREDASAPGIPIGEPIARTQAYILDEQLQPVPVGTVGELYLGGEGLACGYLNHPALTAERFVPHPFSLIPGARLYRTGSLVRRSQKNGPLLFVERSDGQVKLRGQGRS